MPFRSKGRRSYKTRISLPDGRYITAGCGTDDLETARSVERFVKALIRKREWTPLILIVEKKAKLTEIYDAHESGRLDEYMAAQSAPDLQKLLDQWPGKPRYKTQVRQMIAGPYPSHRFTRRTVSEFLAALTVSDSTKNRYRSALSIFASWLVEREVIEHNPVRDVRGYTPNPTPPVWLSRAQSKALIAALPLPHRALEALMAATGMEWQAVARVKRRDIDFAARTVHAQGSKTPWRNRIVRGTELWAWKIFAAYAKQFTPDAFVFGSVDRYRSLEIHKRIAASLDLPETTLHDWRHTFAVQSLRDGYSLTVVAHQLGHRDTTLVQSRYGRYTPSESDYARHAAPRHTEGREARRSR